ncbi:MAG: histidine phosphatase family protein [Proteobacteria bacterium]|nr:histidine phosphatase family protein [Pseudomonadota bacterium]
MRKLTLLRHAKSSWTDHAIADFDRPLAPRGRKAAVKIGLYLAETGLSPDFILCSPAKRTRETLAKITPFLTHKYDIKLERSIYSAGSGGGVISYLKSAPLSSEHVLVIGHNPTMQQLALDLATPEADSRYSDIERKFPTAALAHIEFDIPDWKSLRSRGRLVHYIVPKEL